jgi:hypothetical protein
MNTRLEEILDKCLEEIKGGKSIEECLASYPEHTGEMKGLLEIAASIEGVQRAEPRKEAVDEMLVRMGEALNEQNDQKGTVFGKLFRRPFFSKPVLVRVLATFLVVIVGIWSMGMVSSRSIPGDLLYPVKTTSERIRFMLTRSSDGKIELRLVFADRRLEELLKVAGKRGELDESALESLMEETEKALDGARMMDEARFKFFLTRLDNFNNYTKDALEQMKPYITKKDCAQIGHAIDVCCHRSQHMMNMRKENGKHKSGRKWGPGCRWK